MVRERRRLVAGFWITLIGFLLAFLVASFVPNVPEPPPCATADCNAAYGASLLGLVFAIVGLCILAAALFRGGSAPSPATPGAVVTPPYSFTGTPPPTPAPLSRAPPSPPPPPAVRSCPGCGASVTAEYGFCPRCGRTLSP